MLDIPNERSSHVTPTPRGGGLAIVLCFIIFGIYLKVDIALVTTAGLIAALGFIDDKVNVSGKIRLAIHFSISILFILLTMNFYGITDNVFLIILLFTFLTLFLVWNLNLFNFMDGIDGIASVQAITVSISYLTLIYFFHNDDSLIATLLSLIASTAGFLILNYPPAKIFLGDVGSAFLGFVLASTCILASQIDTNLFYVWIILMGVFITDATYTLFIRLIKRHSIFSAHRTHTYQKASIIFKSHKVVTNYVAMINIFWLLPIATLFCIKLIPLFLALLIAYLPLLLLAYYFKAGKN